MAGNHLLVFNYAALIILLACLLCGCGRASMGQIVTTGVEKEYGAEEDYSLEEGYDAISGTEGSVAEGKDTKESVAEEGGTQGNGWEIYSADNTEVSSEKIGIYIFGAVRRPGVYYLDAGSRLVDAVDAAGGFKKNASKTSINQAAYLKDGQQIKILTKKQAKKQSKGGEYAGGQDDLKEEGAEESLSKVESPEGGGNTNDAEGSLDEGGLVNINSAGKEELMTLSGIGESKAEAVISYRKEQGSFNAIEDIMKVPGIKEGTFNKIKEQITV